MKGLKGACIVLAILLTGSLVGGYVIYNNQMTDLDKNQGEIE